LRTYLTSPNGPEKLLNMLIEKELLVREGHRREIKPLEDAENNDLLYAQTVRSKLLEPCEQPTNEQLKVFYKDFPQLFSTPYYVHVRRIGLKATTVEEVKAAEKKINAIKTELDSDVLDFTTAVEKYSQDKLSLAKKGDLGYLPIVDSKNPIYSRFITAEIGSLIGPVVEKTGLVNLYQVMARRDPILDSYKQVEGILAEEYLKHCNKQRYENLIAELKKRWPVEILSHDVSSALKAQ